MPRRTVTVMLILVVMSTTMLPGAGCALDTLLTGSSNPLFAFAIIPVEILGAYLLDQFVGPLFGDPAGDLFQDPEQGGTEPADN